MIVAADIVMECNGCGRCVRKVVLLSIPLQVSCAYCGEAMFIAGIRSRTATEEEATVARAVEQGRGVQKLVDESGPQVEPIDSSEKEMWSALGIDAYGKEN